MSTVAVLTEYEEQREKNIRLLHNRVLSSLISAGFGEAATLREAFTKGKSNTSDFRA
jgi:hypothetical protein